MEGGLEMEKTHNGGAPPGIDAVSGSVNHFADTFAELAHRMHQHMALAQDAVASNNALQDVLQDALGMAGPPVSRRLPSTWCKPTKICRAIRAK